jgi:sugar phosphate isomerase/epimerase
MQFIGHTMATPGRTVYESIDCFRALGLDGMELMCRPGTDFDSAIDKARAVRMADYANYNGLPIVALTPYAWDINHPEPAVAAAAGGELRRAVHLADLLRARFVRAYSGREQTGDPAGAFARAVEAIRKAGSEAADRGLTLVVENHPGTVTRTGRATRSFLAAVGLASVRALYDPANVLQDTDEPWEETLAVQAGTIAYVHAKDFDLGAGRRRARNLGTGQVPWRAILGRLAEAGYRGPLSLQYEKLWYPGDLDEAETGLAEFLAFARGVLAGAVAGVP